MRPLRAGAQAGDTEAFGELYDLYIEVVFRFVSRLVAHRPTAEDLTADTFFKALRSIGSLRRGSESPRAWLMTIARNTVRDHWRSAHVQRCQPEYALPELPDPEPGPEDHAVLDRDAIMIRGLIQRLPADQRRCLELRYLDGLSLVEVASRMGRTPVAARLLHYRAMCRLRHTLGVDLG